MKTWVKWFLSVILTLIIFAFVSVLTYVIAFLAEGYELPETVRATIAIIGFSLMIVLAFTIAVVSFKEMFDSIESKRKIR